jgi:hypothetical protein
MTANEYFLAWAIYTGAGFFVIMFWCWLTSPLKSITLRLLLRLPALAILLTPIPHVLDKSLYVPAVAAVAFDIISKDSMATSSDVMILIAAVIASLLLALLLGFIGRMISRMLAKESTGHR